MLEQQTAVLRQQIEALLRDYPELADDEFLRADMLEGATDMDQTLTELHRMICDAIALRDGTQPRIDDLMARRARFQKRIDFARDLITTILQSADLKKRELSEVTLSLRMAQPRVLGEPDVSILPDALCRVTRVPDKKAIREALERGDLVPGCVLSNAMPALMIRVK